MKKENKGLKPYYADEANELASDIAKGMNEALIKSGFRKSIEEIILNSKKQERKEHDDILEKRLDD